MTAAAWQWYSAMDAALRGQNSGSQSLQVTANMSAAGDGVIGTPAFAPMMAEKGRGRKRTVDIRDSLFEFLKEQAEREEHWQRDTRRREEERERAESERAERFLILFEKLVNKF